MSPPEVTSNDPFPRKRVVGNQVLGSSKELVALGLRLVNDGERVLLVVIARPAMSVPVPRST